MEVESNEHEHEEDQAAPFTNTRSRMTEARRITLLSFNIALVLFGGCSSPLLLRLYFIHGGSRKWLSSALQTAGFPVLLLPLFFSFLKRRRYSATKPKLFFLTPHLLLCCTTIGLVTGLDDYISSYAPSYLPVSTSSILAATQLGFTAFFAFLVVRQKFTPFNINAVVLLTSGAVVLGVHANGDRPAGESRGKYYLGFFMTIAASVLYALVLPFLELMYEKTEQAVTYTLVMETQLVIGFFATLFCVAGMAVNKDFQITRDRARRRLWLGQQRYVKEMLKKFNMIKCKPVGAPIAVGSKLSAKMCPKTYEEIENMTGVPYASAVGSLMYAMVCTRPDITQAVEVLSRYMAKPGREHWSTVKRVFKYLQGTWDYSIYFEGIGKGKVLDVIGYVDSD